MTSPCAQLTRDAHHQYRWNGRPVTSVTQILRAGGWTKDYSGVSTERLERASTRGTFAHDLTVHVVRGTLTDDMVDASTANYAARFAEICRALDYRPIATNLMLYHPELDYAGELDHAGWMCTNGDVLRALIDVKTERSFHVSAYLQLLFYRELWNRWFPLQRIDRTFVVVLPLERPAKLVANPFDADGMPYVSAALWRHRWLMLNDPKRG